MGVTMIHPDDGLNTFVHGMVASFSRESLRSTCMLNHMAPFIFIYIHDGDRSAWPFYKRENSGEMLRHSTFLRYFHTKKFREISRCQGGNNINTERAVSHVDHNLYHI
jgi:hypothetical protein